MFKYGKITRQGVLQIERKDRIVPQRCFRQKVQISCCDVCPLFGEPISYKKEDVCDSVMEIISKIGTTMPDKLTVLKICENKKLMFETFDDERV